MRGWHKRGGTRIGGPGTGGHRIAGYPDNGEVMTSIDQINKSMQCRIIDQARTKKITQDVLT